MRCFFSIKFYVHIYHLIQTILIVAVMDFHVTETYIPSFSVTKEKLEGFNLYTLEYVHVTVTLEHSMRGDVEIHLNCPSGTRSVLAATRKLDT